jgi:hypothetical protein
MSRVFEQLPLKFIKRCHNQANFQMNNAHALSKSIVFIALVKLKIAKSVHLVNS